MFSVIYYVNGDLRDGGEYASTSDALAAFNKITATIPNVVAYVFDDDADRVSDQIIESTESSYLA